MDPQTETKYQRDGALLPLIVSLLKLEFEVAVIAERQDIIAELAPSLALAAAAPFDHGGMF